MLEIFRSKKVVGCNMKKINKFDFEEEWITEHPLVKQKKVRIADEDDIDEVAVEEDLLESQTPWERGFELGALQASEEWLEGGDLDED